MSRIRLSMRTATSARRKPRLLIVEDEPDLRVLIQYAAKRSEVFSTICTAENGQAALELVRAGLRGERADVPPDLVFSDYHMPRLNGIELAAELRRHPETQHIAVALFTSANTPADRAAARAAGCCAHYDKPATLRELTSILRRLPSFWQKPARDSASPFEPPTRESEAIGTREHEAVSVA